MRTHTPSKSDLQDHDWSTFGNCLDVDPDVMFPGDHNPAAIEEAKAVCQGCPVLQQCISERTRKGDRYGVWGGMTENDRKAAAKRASRQSRKAIEPLPATTAA